MTNKPSPRPVDDDAMLAELRRTQAECCDCPGGYWTSVYTDIVYACRDGISGSMPRDVYDDRPDYLKRSALHAEVLAPIRVLLELEAVERNRLDGMLAKHPQPSPVEQCRRHLERVKAIRALMTAHRLTDSAD